MGSQSPRKYSPARAEVRFTIILAAATFTSAVNLNQKDRQNVFLFCDYNCDYVVQMEEGENEVGDVAMEEAEEMDLTAPEGEELTDNEEMDTTPKRTVSNPVSKGRGKKSKDNDADTDSVGGDVVKIVPKFKSKPAGKKGGKKISKGPQSDGESPQGESDTESSKSSAKRKKKPVNRKKGGAKSVKKPPEHPSSDSEKEDEVDDSKKNKKPVPKKGKKAVSVAKEKKAIVKIQKLNSDEILSKTNPTNAAKSKEEEDSSDDDIPLNLIKDAELKRKTAEDESKHQDKKEEEEKMDIDNDEDDVPMTSEAGNKAKEERKSDGMWNFQTSWCSEKF